MVPKLQAQDVASTLPVQDVVSTLPAQDVVSILPAQDVVSILQVQDVVSTLQVQHVLSTALLLPDCWMNLSEVWAPSGYAPQSQVSAAFLILPFTSLLRDRIHSWTVILAMVDRLSRYVGQTF